MSAYAPSPAGTTSYVKHRIARRHIERRLPWFAPRTLTLMVLSTPIAKPVLRRAYDRYMRSRTHPKYSRGMPSVH
jgi:ribosomal protein L19